MDLLLTTTPPEKTKAALLAIACEEESIAENPVISGLDQALGGALRRVIEEERFRGKPGQTVTLHTLDRLPASRVALIGLGKRAGFRLPALQAFAGRAARMATASGLPSVALVPPPAASADPRTTARMLALGALLGTYRFDRYLTVDKRAAQPLAAAHLVLGPTASAGDLAPALKQAEHVAAAVAQARDLVNEPAGVLTPSRLAEIARDIASRKNLELTVLGRDECAAQGMGLFLAVAQGSVEEPRFIHLAWKPAGAKKRVVLVGKGITFDSGGLSLKPNDGMLDMKTDMAGSAAVLSAMEAVAREAMPVEVHALAACCENMPSGRAYKLGDVLRSKAGKTVEINNTDAEGRLTLADAITYGLELRPDVLLDFATLTGACVVALGPHTAGVMSNNDALQSEWLAAARDAGEEMWPLPLPDRLFDQLKSEIADMKNTGERWGGALTAGLFLREFVGDVPWVHVDIAGPSSTDKEGGHVAKGGTGFAVATIVEYLRRLSAA